MLWSSIRENNSLQKLIDWFAIVEKKKFVSLVLLHFRKLFSNKISLPSCSRFIKLEPKIWQSTVFLGNTHLTIFGRSDPKYPLILEMFYESFSAAGMLFSVAHSKSWKIIFLTSYLIIVGDAQVVRTASTSALTFETIEAFFLKSTLVRVPHISVKQIQGKGAFV